MWIRGRAVGICLFLIVAGVGAIGAVVVGRVLDGPAIARLPLPDPEAGLRFQQTLAQLLLRQAGLSRQSDPLIVTSLELNAFLVGHIEVSRLPTWPVLVRVESGRLELAGRMSLRHLLAGSAVAWLASVLPDRVLDVDVWLAARGRLQVRDGEGELVVDRVTVGRQRVAQAWLWRLLGVQPAEILVWRIPHVVERVDLEPGRLVIHTRRRDG